MWNACSKKRNKPSFPGYSEARRSSPAGFLLPTAWAIFCGTTDRVNDWFTMSTVLKTVALLVANPALSSILSTTLAGSPSLRVRPFETATALKTYLRLAPADLVVLDLDDAQTLARELRDDRSIELRDLQIVALTSSISPDSRADAIDEIIAKPMSPRYLVERVLSRLTTPRRPERRLRGLYKQDWSAFGDNIVPLFGQQPQPRV